jgi:pectate lyase
LPFAVSWPAAPKVTRSVNVATSADFNKAASVAGTLITLTAAISGHVTVDASDIEVHMASGASLRGLTISKALKRIALYGGHYTGTIELAPAS